ncbi:MAG: PDZ domain-containing protein [bacterium]|nr:PDZ domain-containing protein [bacterium]
MSIPRYHTVTQRLSVLKALTAGLLVAFSVPGWAQDTQQTAEATQSQVQAGESAEPSKSQEADKSAAQTEAANTAQTETATDPASKPSSQDEPAQSQESPAVAVQTSSSSEATIDSPPVQQSSTVESSKPSDPNQRLDAIESKLDKLVDTVQTLVESQAKMVAPSTEKETATPETPAEPQQTQPSRPAFKVEAEWLKELPWRSLGPANMGGRITDLEIHSQDTSLWWVATGGGGLLKTTNRGVSVEHQFDSQTTVSIGAIASDPQNKDVLWVGTGEINPRNSVSYGDGVYKSVDGGKSFTNMGLRETYQISRILIHPQNSDVVYVGAQGRLYGTNAERGVFKTTDGGAAWEKVLYLDDRTGVIDMIMHPQDPDTLIVAMWDRLRDGFDSWPGSVPKPDGIDGYDPIRKWGPKAGLYKTTDGGANWKKLSVGLPTGMTGRIGLDWQLGAPHTIYAIIDCEDIGKGPKPFDAFLGLTGTDVQGKATVTQVMPDSPAAEAGVQPGDLLVSVEGNEIFEFDSLLDVLREKKVGERIELSFQRGSEVVAINPKLAARPGTRTTTSVYLGVTGKDVEGKIELTEVAENGPASKAGLEPGDLIVAMEDEALQSYEKWVESIQDMAIGDQVKLSVERGEEKIEVTVTLEQRPGSAPASSAYMGIQGEDASSGGAVLTVVTPDGPSDKAGVKAGDIVVKVGDKEIKGYDALIEEIRARQAEEVMQIEVKRGEKTLQLKVTLGDRNAGSGDRPYTYSYFGQRPNVQDQQGSKGYNYGGVYKSTDAGETWQRVNSINVRPMYFSVVRVDPSNDQNVYLLGVSQFQSTDGGVTFTADLGRGVHSDCHDLWIDPNDGRHMVIGSDGGFYVTYDRGKNWDHINTAAVGQFYHVTIAPKQPYCVYGGLQDNGSWGGPAISNSGGALNEDWVNVGGGDGFVCRVDLEDPDIVYSESQNGSIRRRNLRTGEGASIRPRPEKGIEYRFNWNTPFILSNHNSKIFYSGGNYVFKSYNQGDDLKRISPEITLTQRGSATALSESPLNPDVLYAGTDDGGLWVTRDGGNEWISIHENLPVDPRWVATIEASRYEEGRVYVCLDGHRSDDDAPHIFVSEDFGASFTSLVGDLPRGSTRCLREDVVNPNLLFLGTEFAFWLSLDRGQNWTQCNQQLPTVAVHEVAMHPSINEIVLATHGRSLWACDVSSLRSLKPEYLTKSIALLPPGEHIRWRRGLSRGGTNRSYAGQNPDREATLWYALPNAVEQVSLRIENIEGEVVANLKGNTEPGLHSVNWNLLRSPPREQSNRDNAPRRPQPVPTGDYRVVLVVDGKDQPSQVFRLLQDPTLPADAIGELEYQRVNDALQADGEAEQEASSDAVFEGD